MEKVLRYIELGKKEGATLFKGGNRMDRKGYFIEQTIFTDVEDHMAIAKDEIFGPVTCVMKVSDNEEAVRRANNTDKGLVAGVFAQDVSTCMPIANKLQAGSVFINNYMTMNATTPFGGWKLSGYGSELSTDSIDSYMKQKAFHLSY